MFIVIANGTRTFIVFVLFRINLSRFINDSVKFKCVAWEEGFYFMHSHIGFMPTSTPQTIFVSPPLATTATTSHH